MEIFNENRVALPELPARPGKKLALAYEVAGRIVEHMNRNEPGAERQVDIIVRHHGGKSTGDCVFLSDGIGEGRCWRSGSKIVEAVYALLSRISCIEWVRVDIPLVHTIGKFAP